MATYTDAVTRTGAQALMPEDVSKEILGMIEEPSVVMTLARQLPNMSRKQTRLPVIGSIPQAFFVTGDTGRKQATTMAWDNVFINAEELAVLVPVPNAVIDDSDYDIWGEIKGPITSAIGKAVDQAILYGINAPAAWPECIVEGAEAAGHEVTVGEIGDIYDDIMGVNGVLDLVERDGYLVNGHAASPGMKARLRGLRSKAPGDTGTQRTGETIFVTGLMTDGKASYSLDGEQLLFPRNGALDPSRSLLISGDWDQLVYSIRQDLTFEVFPSGVISDDAGAVVFNAMQQDSAIMRVVIRLGWALPNPVNLVNTNAATRYPFAIYEPTASS